MVPSQRAHASLPFHRVGAHSVHGAKTHLVELSNRCHPFYVEFKSLTILDTSDAKVKPSVVVAFRLVR